MPHPMDFTSGSRGDFPSRSNVLASGRNANMPTVSVLHILRTIKERGSIARTDLQQLTGLSWGTITNTTRELLDRNLIVEEGAASTKAGRKPMRLALNRTAQFLVGLDIAPDVMRCLV